MLSRRGFVRLGRSLAAALCLGAPALSLSACDGADRVAARSAAQDALAALLAAPVTDDAALRLLGSSTVEQLEAFGLSATDYVAHCVAHASVTVDEASVSGDTASVGATVDNADLDAAMTSAEQSFDAYLSGDEAQTSYDEGGEAALMTTLFQYFYDAVDAAATTSTSVTLTATKGDDGWSCDPTVTPELVAALVGSSPTSAADASSSAS